MAKAPQYGVPPQTSVPRSTPTPAILKPASGGVSGSKAAAWQTALYNMRKAGVARSK